LSGGSIGTIAGGAIGGILGAFVGAPGLGLSIGATLGGAIGGALDPPKAPKIEGQRLNDLTVQTSTYGSFIPRVYGTLTLFGNVFWIENNQVKEVSKKVKQGGKGLGGSKASAKTYSYYGTFAIGLCEGPITGIRRIWIGPKLFYDAGSADVNVLIQSQTNAQYFKVYLGDDTQLADPRMQATLGVTNVPGYRGQAYIVFYDLPLAEYGNSVALTQIKIEVVKSGTTDYILENISVVGDSIFPVDLDVYENTFVFTANLNETNITIYDVSDPYLPLKIKTLAIGQEQTCVTISGNKAYYGKDSGGIAVINIGSSPESAVLESNITIQSLSEPGFAAILHCIRSDNNYLYCLTFGGYLQIYTLAGDFLGWCATGFIKFGGFTYGNGIMDISEDYIYLASTVGDSFQVIDITNKSAPTVVSTLALTGIPTGVSINGDYAYITFQSSSIASDGVSAFTVVDISNPLLPTVVIAMDLALSITRVVKIQNDYAFVASNSGLTVFNISNPELPVVVATIANARFNQAHSMAVYGNYIYMTNHASNNLDIFLFIQPTIASDLIPLSEIVQAETLESELVEAADIDVTSLTPLVRGYRISQVGAIRGGIDQLQAAWPFDAIQSGYQIKYILRGGSSVATIDEDFLDAREIGQAPGVQISNVREMDVVLPAKVSLKFFDVNREYDTGDQYAERINTDAINIREIELAIVLTAEEAAQKAEILLYLYWMERYEISFKLSPEYSELEPADIITITSSKATYIVRLTSINYTVDGRLECKARYHIAAVYISYATGEIGQSTGVDIVIPGSTLYRLLDIPMLQDVYDQSGYPIAMTGYQSGWPGGVLFVTDDDGQTWNELQAFTPPGSTIGYAKDTLSTHGGTVIDYSSRLTIRLYNGTLSSITQDQMFQGLNWFAYGVDGRFEIIAAMNVLLQSDDDYLLFDFLRGQAGTEWATGLHQIGDAIVLLDSDTLAFITTSSGFIGLDRKYRGITVGETIDTDSDLTFSYDGVNLEPLSPTHLTGNRHPTTNDWTITWKRRSRYMGWRNLADIPLGETTESYEIDVYSSATYTTLKRTLIATTETVQYTSAQQVTDFGSNQSTIYLKVYQLSSVVGRGYALTQSLTRT
jgi:hypothetical protein